jgi:dephospho-CoA kinase
MVVVGLTGSIAMGKSTVASMFSELGAPVFDADAAVRDFYSTDGAAAVGEIFPEALIEGRIDRQRLSHLVLHDADALKRLESVVHPAVAAARTRFLRSAASKGRRIAVVDVPLLLETGGDSAVDVVVVVSAAENTQRRRALGREAMTERKFDAIVSRQMSDSEKRRRAHFVIDTDGVFEKTREQISQFLRSMAGIEGRTGRHA